MVTGLTLLCAAVAALAALVVVLSTDVLHGALALIVVLLALAGVYAGSGAWLIAAVQIIVYAGAVMVLFLFVIMVLESRHEHAPRLASFRLNRLAAAVVGAALLALMTGYARVPAGTPGNVEVIVAPAAGSGVVEFSTLLFHEFLLPFELVGLLLLVAVVAVMTLTGPRDAR